MWVTIVCVLSVAVGAYAQECDTASGNFCGATCTIVAGYGEVTGTCADGVCCGELSECPTSGTASTACAASCDNPGFGGEYVEFPEAYCADGVCCHKECPLNFCVPQFAVALLPEFEPLTDAYCPDGEVCLVPLPVVTTPPPEFCEFCMTTFIVPSLVAIGVLEEDPAGGECELPDQTCVSLVEETTPVMETTLAAEATTLAAEDTTLAAVDTTLAAADTTLAAVDTTLAAADTTLAAADTTLAAADTTLAAVDTTLAAVDTTVLAAIEPAFVCEDRALKRICAPTAFEALACKRDGEEQGECTADQVCCYA